MQVNEEEYPTHATSLPVGKEFCTQAICLLVNKEHSLHATSAPVGEKFSMHATCVQASKVGEEFCTQGIYLLVIKEYSMHANSPLEEHAGDLRVEVNKVGKEFYK